MGKSPASEVVKSPEPSPAEPTEAVKSPEPAAKSPEPEQAKSPEPEKAKSPRMIEECDERPKNDTALLGSPSAEEKALAEEIDIDLTDPNTEDAAVKIQAAFRGHQVRRNNNENNNIESTVTEAAEEPVATEDPPKDG